MAFLSSNLQEDLVTYLVTSVVVAYGATEWPLPEFLL